MTEATSSGESTRTAPIPDAGGERFVDGLNLFVSDHGQGSAVLLLHGFPFTHRCFGAVAPSLAGGHRVLAVDLPGFGESDRPPAFPYDVVAYADAMAELLRADHAAPAAIVGHGFGAAIALAMAVLQPDTVRRLVLVGPAVYPQPISLWLRAALSEFGPAWWFWRLAFRRERLARHLRQDVFLDAGMADEGMVDYLWGMLQRPGGSEAARRVLAAAVRLEPVAELPPRVRCKSLVVWGESDRVVPPRLSRRLATEIDGARSQEIARSGHSPHQERPEPFLEAVIPFLAES